MARPDLNALLETALPFAQQMLEEHGDFYPFGATMKVDGKIDQTAASTGEELGRVGRAPRHRRCCARAESSSPHHKPTI